MIYMSISLLQSTVDRKNRELMQLKKERIKYVNEISDCGKRILSANTAISRTKSASTMRNKLREIERYTKKRNEAEKKVTSYDIKISNKEKEILKAEESLHKEQMRETKKNIDNINLELDRNYTTQEQLIIEIEKLKEAKEKINILFMAANPDIVSVLPSGEKGKAPLLKLEKEAREIHESIQKSCKRDSINFETRWATRVTDIFQYINEVTPTIIHFSGHGTEDGMLVFQDNQDMPKCVSMESIIDVINASSDDLRLVVLNNCFSSLISEKIVNTVEASIGMNDSIGDEAAVAFASQLYSSIGFGNSLQKSFDQAIAQLKLLGINEADTPVLYVKNGISASDIYLVKK